MGRRKLKICQMSIKQLDVYFPNEEACREYLEKHRWPDGVCCPRCGNFYVSEHGSMKAHWICYECSPNGIGYRFSVLVGTIFENTNKPLMVWFRVIHLMLFTNNETSVLKICHRMNFGSYKSAWAMCRKIRAAYGNDEFKKMIGYDVPNVDANTKDILDKLIENQMAKIQLQRSGSK